METVTSLDGTTIGFERTGSGPPLVMVHGSAGDHTRWEPVRPALEEQCTVYAIDRRGRGGSGDAPEYERQREAEDVAAVVDAIDEPVNLFGHSYGAVCALEAVLQTDNLRRVMLYEPWFAVGDHELYDAEVLAEMEQLMAEGKDEQVLILFAREVADIPQESIDALRSLPSWENRVAAAHTLPRETRSGGEYEFDAARFAEMTTPTLLLSGSDSPTVFKAATQTVDEALPNSRIGVFDGHGHVTMNTAPDLFVDEVLAFIGEGDERIGTPRGKIAHINESLR